MPFWKRSTGKIENKAHLSKTILDRAQLTISKDSNTLQRTRLVIGIDFGTTFVLSLILLNQYFPLLTRPLFSFSGAAFAISNPEDTPEETKIYPIRDWKGQLAGDTTSNKVPSTIAYGKDHRIYWGFDIPQSMGFQSFRWMKLLLEPTLNLGQSDVIDLAEIQRLLEQTHRTAIEVASDYVRCLWEHVKGQIIKDHGLATFEFAEKSIVLTVPAEWTPAAKDNTYKVAVGAGLVSPDYKLFIVPEPEAAAIAVLRDRASSFMAGDCFIVCDAGGGTVDLASYLIQSTNPLCLSERVVGKGEFCGGVFLDLAFKRLLRTYLKSDTFDNLPPLNVARIMNDFEYGIKRTYDGSDQTAHTISLPGVPDDPDVQLQANIMRLSVDVLNTVFDPVMAKVERLVRKQIERLAEKDFTAKAILLVGGFGTNRYMASRLKARYERPQGPRGAIEVLQPNISWESIANGAVRGELMGISNIISVRISRYNCGILHSEAWVETKHNHRPEDKYFCPYRQQDRASHQIRWVLRKGSEVKPGEEVTFEFRSIVLEEDIDQTSNKVKVRSSLVRSNEDDAPGHSTAAVQPFVHITFLWDRSDLVGLEEKRSKQGKKFWYPSYDILMIAGPAKLEFACVYKGVRKGEAQMVEYNSSMDEDAHNRTVGAMDAIHV